MLYSGENERSMSSHLGGLDIVSQKDFCTDSRPVLFVFFSCFQERSE